MSAHMIISISHTDETLFYERCTNHAQVFQIVWPQNQDWKDPGTFHCDYGCVPTLVDMHLAIMITTIVEHKNFTKDQQFTKCHNMGAHP